MEERSVSVGHSSINRWAIRFLALIEKMARKHKRPIGGRPRSRSAMDKKQCLIFMLKTHNRTVTYTELARAAGFENFGAVSIQYGKPGRALG